MTSTDDRAAFPAAFPVPAPARPRIAGISRRSALTAGALGVAGVALAACSQAAAPDDPTVRQPDAGSASSGGASGSGGALGSDPSAGSSVDAGKPLAQLSAIPIGSAVSATGPNGDSLIIARPTADTVAAFSAVCTHQACTVVPAGKELDCPCHGSVYNATTGAVITGPAPEPLPRVQVTLSGDTVLSA
jgi:cytochrome b6-f complex iron-sulfur subunit